MSIVDFIAVVSFGLTCFSIGYTLGKVNHKPQKYTSTSLITAAPPKATTAVTTNCIGFGKFSNTKTFLLLYHAYVYLKFLILACTIYILAPIHLIVNADFNQSEPGRHS